VRPPRIGRLAFMAGSTLAFMPALGLAASDAMDGVGAMASAISVEIGPDGAWEAPAMSAVPAGMSGPSAATLALTLAGWAAFGWLAAGRTRDLGEDARVAWAVVPGALVTTLPASPWWLSVPAVLALLAWSTRLSLAKAPRRKVP